MLAILAGMNTQIEKLEGLPETIKALENRALSLEGREEQSIKKQDKSHLGNC
jgi:hypothetical protein